MILVPTCVNTAEPFELHFLATIAKTAGTEPPNGLIALDVTTPIGVPLADSSLQS